MMKLVRFCLILIFLIEACAEDRMTDMLNKNMLGGAGAFSKYREERLEVDATGVSMSMMDTPTSVPTQQPTAASETLIMTSETTLAGISCDTFLGNEDTKSAFIQSTQASLQPGGGSASLKAATVVTITDCDAGRRLLREMSRRLSNAADIAWQAKIEDVQQYGYVSANALYNQSAAAYVANEPTS